MRANQFPGVECSVQNDDLGAETKFPLGDLCSGVGKYRHLPIINCKKNISFCHNIGWFGLRVIVVLLHSKYLLLQLKFGNGWVFLQLNIYNL